MLSKKVFSGLMVMIILLCLTFTVSAISIKYSDSYLPKESLSNYGSTGGDIKSIGSLISNKEKQVDSLKSNYPKVKIAEKKVLGLFGGDPIIDFELIDHTEFCTVNCYSILEVTVHQSTKLMDKIETRTLSSGYVNDVADIEVFILKEVTREKVVNEKVRECKPSKFAQGVISCSYFDYGNARVEYSTVEEFVKYNNEELIPGTYIVKIKGEKKFNSVVDWVINFESERIEALAWWNNSELYGNGTLGNVIFTTSTKSYGNMVSPQDYTVSGNSLRLYTDREYDFESFYLGAGTTLTTMNTTGAVVYLLATDNMTLLGNIDLSNKILRANSTNGNASTTFSYIGDVLTTPGGGQGGDAYAGGTGSDLGYGGGGSSSEHYSCGDVPSPGDGGDGGYTFGVSGASTLSSSSGGSVCMSYNGTDANDSGGGGGPSSALSSATDGITYGSGGAGGNNYGVDGGDAGVWGVRGAGWVYGGGGSTGNAGGGAGGEAGKPGLNLVLRSKTLVLSGTINVAGTAAGDAGRGGDSYSGIWKTAGGGYWEDIQLEGAYGGGGGGGGDGGNVYIYYRHLTNSTSVSSLISQDGGLFGLGKDGGNTGYTTSFSDNGTSGSSGVTVLYEESYADTVLLSPLSGEIVIPSVLNFSTYITPYGVTLVNTTLYLWNSTSVYTNTTSLSGTSPVSVNWTRTSDQLEDDTYIWMTQTCWTDGSVHYCEEENNITFSTFSVIFGNTTYSNVTYEMINHTFTINVTSTGTEELSADFVWGGISYPAATSGNLANATFTRSIWIPIGAGNTTFYWDITYGGVSKTSDPEEIMVLSSYMFLCNSTSNQSYLTLNYKDETTNAEMNATIVTSLWYYNVSGSPYGKQFTYVSPTNVTQELNLSHSFCFTPNDSSIIIEHASVQVGNPTEGYATKIWPYRNYPLTNVTTTNTIYLISLTDSGLAPVTFQAVDSVTGESVSGVRIMTYRTIGGTSTLVNDGYTDDSGSVAYYLSPITAYVISTTGGGCNAFSASITPTSNLYTIQLSCTSSSLSEFTTGLDGVTYQRSPSDGVTIPGSTQFDYYVSSASNTTFKRVRFEITNARTGAILAYNDSLVPANSCEEKSCLLTLTYDTYTGDNIKAKYYVGINGTSDGELILLEADAYWRFIVIDSNDSVNAFGRMMIRMQELFYTWGSGTSSSTVNCFEFNNDEASCTALSSCRFVNDTRWTPADSIYSGDITRCIPSDIINKAEFNRMVFIFSALTVTLFILGKTTGYELNHPGSFLVIMTAFIWFLSFYGLFTFEGLTSSGFLNKYIFALSTGCVGIGYTMSIIRRYSQ